MSMSSLVYILMLLILIFYIFAIIGILLFRENDRLHFNSIGVAFLTLFQCSTGDSWSSGVMEISMWGCNHENFVGGYPQCLCKSFAHGAVAALYFISFVFISALVVLNLIIGTIDMSMQQVKAERAMEEREIAEAEQLEQLSDFASDMLGGDPDRRGALAPKQQQQQIAPFTMAVALQTLSTRKTDLDDLNLRLLNFKRIARQAEIEAGLRRAPEAPPWTHRAHWVDPGVQPPLDPQHVVHRDGHHARKSRHRRGSAVVVKGSPAVQPTEPPTGVVGSNPPDMTLSPIPPANVPAAATTQVNSVSGNVTAHFLYPGDAEPPLPPMIPPLNPATRTQLAAEQREWQPVDHSSTPMLDYSPLHRTGRTEEALTVYPTESNSVYATQHSNIYRTVDGDTFMAA